MITIEYLYDKNDRQQFIDCINDIVIKAQTEPQYGEMAGRIAQVLDYIEDIGIPPHHLRTITGTSIKGDIITLTDVVKELKDHPPLLEFRVNWKPIGAFRAIFFYAQDTEGNQTIYFTKAVIKQHTYSQDFENAVRESEEMLREFCKEG